MHEGEWNKQVMVFDANSEVPFGSPNFDDDKLGMTDLAFPINFVVKVHPARSFKYNTIEDTARLKEELKDIKKEELESRVYVDADWAMKFDVDNLGIPDDQRPFEVKMWSDIDYWRKSRGEKLHAESNVETKPNVWIGMPDGKYLCNCNYRGFEIWEPNVNNWPKILDLQERKSPERKQIISSCEGIVKSLDEMTEEALNEQDSRTIFLLELKYNQDDFQKLYQTLCRKRCDSNRENARTAAETAFRDMKDCDSNGKLTVEILRQNLPSQREVMGDQTLKTLLEYIKGSKQVLDGAGTDEQSDVQKMIELLK
jgi:hypothetical protein